MYIHGELLKHGFELTEIHAFGDPKECTVNYQFKNEHLTAHICRKFDGKFSLSFSENGSPEKTDFMVGREVSDVDIIHLVRNFLVKHA